jgi:hypothetical protein
MGLLYGRAGRLTAHFGDFRRGQYLQTFSAGEVEAFLDDARDGRWRR